MASADSTARRANRRGQATRDAMLEAALHVLASGDPSAVSANYIAKKVGATWGAVQYQFGDTDGFWAAVLHHTAQRRAQVMMFGTDGADATLHDRVSEIVETLYQGLTNTDSRAIENLRAALPRDPDELDRSYPRTAAELRSWGQSWQETCQKAFADLGVDPKRIAEVAAFIPGAMRGLVSEKQLGSYADLGEARRGLTNAIVAYLGQSQP
ncbi:TetR/AcrR family transcriptional regulator [Mycolicibacterium moriokaense]|nr:TetR/AcrR family transcriptional regulator [Mycolicibacterium moriokaense]